MPYIFPTRRLRDEDVLDPTYLTDDFARAAEALTGRLDSHNISKTVDLGHDQRATGALFKVNYTEKEKNPAFGEHPYAAPGTAPDATQLILSNAMQWQSVVSKDVTLKAPSKLWITGWLQYCWLGFTDDPKDHFPGHDYSDIGDSYWYSNNHGGVMVSTYGARVQFAIRVNGRVLEWTVTGSQTPHQQANVPLKPRIQRSHASQFPGPAHNRVHARSSMGPEALPLRIGSVFEVPGGDNTIEIVARREHDLLHARDLGGRSAGNVISLFNRQLLVVDYPAWPEIYTLSLHDALPIFESPVIKHGRNTLTPGSAYEHRNIYPGDDSEYVTFSYTDMNEQGWCMLANRTYVSTGVSNWKTNDYFCAITKSFTFTVNRPSYLIVFADIQLIALEGPNAKSDTKNVERTSVRHFGLFRLGYHKEGDSVGEWTLPKVTECFANSTNAWGQWPGSYSTGAIDNYQMVNENINVPMMMVLDFTDITSPVTIDGIAPFTCGASLGSSDGPFVELRRASIHAIQIDEG